MGNCLSNVLISLGVRDYRMAQVLGNLGGVTNYLGLMEQAAAYLEEGAELMGVLYGSKDHPVLHQIYFNLSSNYQSIGAMEKAKLYMRRARSITLKIDENNPVTIDELIHLADIHSNLGEFEEAIASIDVALAKATKILGPDHVKVGEVYLILGEIHRDMRQFEQAAINYKKAVEIMKNNQGVDLRQMASVYGSLGVSQIELKEIAQGWKI